jgi:hypothetical protein
MDPYFYAVNVNYSSGTVYDIRFRRDILLKSAGAEPTPTGPRPLRQWSSSWGKRVPGDMQRHLRG